MDQNISSFINLTNPYESFCSSEPHQNHDHLDTFDIQSVPSLMSPNLSSKDLSEDEDMEEYQMYALSTGKFGGQQEDKFMTPLRMLRQSRPMILESAFNESTLIPQHLPSPPYSSYNELTSFDNMYTQFNHGQQIQLVIPVTQPQQQQQQPQLQLQLQQQQHHPHSTMYPTPSMTPIGSFESGIPAHMNCHTSSSIQYFISSLEQPLQQQQQSDPSIHRHSIQGTSPSLEQNMDLLMVPQLDGGAYNAEPLSLLLSPTASLVQSPTLSWVSISRDVSPECMPTSATNKKSSVRPFKKRSGSAHSRSLAKVGSESSALPQHTSGASSTPSPSTAATSIPAKRKRRIRQMKVKAKPTTFVCDSPGCGKVFSRAYNLTSHMKTHSAERPFLCGTCPLAFARRHDRERHVRLHTGEKPYSCESCGCVFMRNDALHRHQRMCGQSPAALMALLQPQTQIHTGSTMAL